MCRVLLKSMLDYWSKYSLFLRSSDCTAKFTSSIIELCISFEFQSINDTWAGLKELNMNQRRPSNDPVLLRKPAWG